MRAMILAAGRGERLRPLTDTTPKPLIKLGEWRLIEWQILALKRAGIDSIVINVAWLGDQILQTLGSGERYGVDLIYSHEGDTVLGTAGGIIRALPLLGDAPFIVCNADVWTDFDYTELPLRENSGACLVLVENPEHHPQGDFSLQGSRLVRPTEKTYTFSGIGIYTPQFFANVKSGVQSLAPLLFDAIDRNNISATKHSGIWCDVGTPERLESARHDMLRRFDY
ncbi:MAG: N-acetylmuramate alpha-1-phosphate uridylyltransferase MurU [Pseudomonadota bacterium]